MSTCYYHIPYSDTHAFSKLVTDYLEQSPSLAPYYVYGTDATSIEKVIADRKRFPIDRRLLVEVLEAQYAGLEMGDAVRENLEKLKLENTFTICTAHQPNLLTGYLYFIYKIMHAIKMVDMLQKQYPENHFVPVYYMGSEDNDLEELGRFWYEGQAYVWDADGQQGAVGSMNTQSLSTLLHQLYRVMGPPGEHTDELKTLLSTAYLQHNNIADATRYLVHQLFKKYGLVVLDPNDAQLKRKFIPIMKEELHHHSAYEKVNNQTQQLARQYKVQAYPRPINLFYMDHNLRERIEKTPQGWQVLHTNIHWTAEELNEMLETHPERFSPNVILRGLYQEMVLPNIVFIGGGSEVAYWLQLLPAFQHYNLFFPSLHLRQSIQWIDTASRDKYKQLGLTIPDLFLKEQILTKQLLTKADYQWDIQKEMQSLEQILYQMKEIAVQADSTLDASANAVLAKIRKQVAVLEQKIFRAQKRKESVLISRMQQLKAKLFPGGGLQERKENFLEYYILYGPAFFDYIYEGIEPFRHEFLVIER